MAKKSSKMIKNKKQTRKSKRRRSWRRKVGYKDEEFEKERGRERVLRENHG